jgi:RNA polymerase sigma-70 factor (ECF subfamily)
MVGGTLINRFLSLQMQFGAESSREQIPAPAIDATSDDVLQRIANGDEMALGELYDCYAPGLYRVLLAILKSHEDTEDALQELFLRVASGRTKRARDLRTYLYTCARHIALDTLRRRKRQPLYEDADELSEVLRRKPRLICRNCSDVCHRAA